MSSGYLHSVEIGSFVDGPGLRFVAFLAGCPLRCQYCHNPDTWQLPAEKTDSEDLLARIDASADFLAAAGGGVTISGGEPLMQPRFAQDILEGSQALGLHTALDTSGYLGAQTSDEFLASVDLVLLDIKAFDDCVYRELTGRELEPTITFAQRLSAAEIPMWVRYVLVPGITDNLEHVDGLARFLGGLSNVELVQVLPFHQMARHKYEELGIEYRLANVEPPSQRLVEQVKAVFESQGLPVDQVRISPIMSTASKE